MNLAEAMDVFDAVADGPDPAGAATAACRGRPEVLALVLRLLDADRRSRGFDTGAAEGVLAADLARDAEAPLPERLGRYRILGELGRGGMGRVLDAEQEQPRRKVALKVIHPRLVSERTRAWLAAEAEALGRVLHPGIPQVYEAFDDHGVVGLVMERVDGLPLLAWTSRLPLRARAQVVRRIATIVAHAHEAGLLHRDLKPANVLVTRDGQPKVLDFGLAMTLGTEATAVVGTPGYMAPEQRAGGRLDVRTDVYALGRLLGVVLTGRLAEGRLSAGHPELAGDLDAIYARATARSPRDRYPSARALAADLDRFLQGYPVAARRGGRAYVARKFVARNRGLVAGSAFVALLMALATVFSSWMAVRATRAGRVAERERHVADAARRRAEVERQHAERARAAADEEARRARRTSEFLTDVFLRAHPTKGGGGATLSEATRAAADRLDDGRLPPEEEASFRMAVAEAMWGERDMDAAARQIDRVVALYTDGRLPPNETVADAFHGRAEVARIRGDWAVHDAALDEALRIAVRLESPRRHNELLHTRGWGLLERGRLADALPWLERALTSKRPAFAQGVMPVTDLVNTLAALADAYDRAGRPGPAAALIDEALAEVTRVHGDRHLALGTLHHVAIELKVNAGDLDAALAHATRVGPIRDALGLPADHPMRVSEPFELARVLLRRGDLDAALAAVDAAWRPERALSASCHLVVVECRVAAGRDAVEVGDVAVASARGPVEGAVALGARGLARRAAGHGDADLAEARRRFAEMYGPETPWIRRFAPA